MIDLKKIASDAGKALCLATVYGFGFSLGVFLFIAFVGFSVSP